MCGASLERSCVHKLAAPFPGACKGLHVSEGVSLHVVVLRIIPRRCMFHDARCRDLDAAASV